MKGKVGEKMKSRGKNNQRMGERKEGNGNK